MGNGESQEFDNVSILLLGKTGVGKSALINCIFGEELAEEGTGLPCTSKITPYTKENSHITLYDTPSFALNPSLYSNFKTNVLDFIKEQSKSKDFNRKIQCIWFCIDSNSSHIDEYEKQFISVFKNIPVIIVLTKSINQDKTNEMMREIEINKLNIKYIVPVLAKKTDDLETFGINELFYFTVNLLPPSIKEVNVFDHLQFNNKLQPPKNQINIDSFKKNILVLGKRGVGKSTLINTILGEKKAKTGIGLPIINEIEEFDSDDSQYIMFDTPGLEFNSNQHSNFKNQILKLINDRSEKGDIKMFIHCIWYCVDCYSKIIENDEINFINEIRSKASIPVILVLTQCYSDDITKEMMTIINQYHINIDRISPIIAEKENFSDFEPGIIEPFGLDELVSFTNLYISNNLNLNNACDYFDNIEEEVKTLKKFNIIVAGKFGSGKKTLINTILDDDIAIQINDFNTVNEYEKENNEFHLFHFHDFDENPIQQIKLREKMIRFVKEKYETRNFKEVIHCIWYCVQCKNDLDEQEIDFLNIFSNQLKEYKVPIILVITNCHDNNIKDTLIQNISNNHQSIKYYQPILAQNHIISLDPFRQIEHFGIDDLILLTKTVINDSFLPNSLNSQVSYAMAKTMNNMGRINIITIGKAGVGKSTLINSFFRGHLAATGIGAPVTQRITPLTTPNNPLTIYDTPGIELNPKQQKELRNDICKLIKDGYQSNDINKFIHCIWYCISTESCRFEDSEKEFIQELTKVTSIYQVPVFIILTQSYRMSVANQMKEKIAAENLHVMGIIPVVAQPKKILGSICKEKGKKELTEMMGENLPEVLKDTFSNVQIASISYKRKRAIGAIAGFVAGSAAVGASPIPFSDCFLLAGIEVSMFTTITAIYHVEVSHGFITTVLSCLIGCSAATLIGRTVVINLIKIIPFAGSIVGAVAGGITGAILTAAFGATYMAVMEAVLKGEIDPKKITKSELKEFIGPIFNKKLEEEKEKEKMEKIEKKDNDPENKS